MAGDDNISRDETLTKRVGREIEDFAAAAKKAPIVAVVAILILLAPVGGWLFNWLRSSVTIEKLEQSNAALTSKLAETTTDLTKKKDDAVRDKIAAETRLAPFIAQGVKLFQDAPPNQRLDLLLEAIQRIDERLKPKLPRQRVADFLAPLDNAWTNLTTTHVTFSGFTKDLSTHQYNELQALLSDPTTRPYLEVPHSHPIFTPTGVSYSVELNLIRHLDGTNEPQ